MLAIALHHLKIKENRFVKEGKLVIREGDIKEMNTEELGKANLITDMMRTLSYETEFSKATDKILGALKVGGVFYVQYYGGDYEFGQTWFLDGSRKLGWEEYFRLIPGIRVERLKTGKLSSLKITRLAEEIGKAPQTKLISLYASKPPGRIFKIGF